MRLLVTGGSGLLGADLLPAAKARGHEIVAPSSSEFNITDLEAVARFSSGAMGKFDWCLNLAAYTNVDGAETDVRDATELNVLGPGYLAQACLFAATRMLHISTDYVFGGNAGTAFGEDDPVAPIQKYGETKAEGERAVLQANGASVIARISWLFGASKRCFPVGLVEAFRAGKPMRIVDDQFGVPSYTVEVSRMLTELIEADPEPGIYHVAGSDAVSRFEYAQSVARAFAAFAGAPLPLLEPVPSSTFPTPARRPANSVITTDKVRRYVAPHMPLDAAMKSFVESLAG